MSSVARHIRRGSNTLLAIALGVGLGWLDCRNALAIDRDTLVLLTLPLEPSLFESGAPDIPPAVVTPDRVSQTGLTPPSLWWTDEQFGSDLLSYWLAYSGADGTPPRVDLLVDQEVWSNYNYLRRYVFMNQFGTAAKAFGYSTRVFNLQGELLGAYICEFDQTQANDTTCSVFLNPYGRGAFSGSTSPFGAASPTGGGMLPNY